ncbi:MAG: hypothetical protein HY720_03760 [Planctomycetes bacterium]|nr:hypothetical protein [Planctomycetota bacterium]
MYGKILLLRFPRKRFHGRIGYLRPLRVDPKKPREVSRQEAASGDSSPSRDLGAGR